MDNSHTPSEQTRPFAPVTQYFHRTFINHFVHDALVRWLDSPLDPPPHRAISGSARDPPCADPGAGTVVGVDSSQSAAHTVLNIVCYVVAKCFIHI